MCGSDVGAWFGWENKMTSLSLRVGQIDGLRETNPRLLAVNLYLETVNEDGHDPLENDASHSLRMIIERVKDVVGTYYTRNPVCGATNEDGEDGRTVTIYFPFIVINDDPIYKVLTRMISKSLNDACFFEDKRNRYGIVNWTKGSRPLPVSIEKNPQHVQEIKRCLSFGCESVSERHIQAQRAVMTTAHTLSLAMDQFSMLLEYYIEIHKTEPEFFSRNIRYIAGAFYRHKKRYAYAERERSSVVVDDWLKVTDIFGIDPLVARRYYNDVENYAYTTTTMEEVLRDHKNKWYSECLDHHNTSKLRHSAKQLITQARKPSHDQLWELFAGFVRHDHFYAESRIWVLDDSRCVQRGANELRPVIRKFTNLIRDGKLAVMTDAHYNDDLVKGDDIDDRIEEMCKPFENRASCKFVEDACANYLCTQIKTAIRGSAIPFRDLVLVFDQNKLYERRAYMEDQFTSTAPVSVKGFGHTDRDKRAVQDIRDLLYKMFVHKENVDWNIRWMGSLLAHRPERVCSIWYGPKGGNAKTTFTKILVWLFGEYAVQCRPDILITNKNGGQTCTPFEAELQGRVLAVISEPQKTQVYSSSTLKDMTGSDLKIAAKKYKDPVQFEQTAKPIILSNHLPQFDDVTQPLTDRLFISHCYGRFTTGAPLSVEQQRKEHHYPADNDFWTDERKQALAWLIIYEGFPAYIKEGLNKTSYQRKELLEYTKENSDFMRFAEKCKEDLNGERCLTTAMTVHEIFKKKFPRKYDTMSFDDFITEFARTTGHNVVQYDDQDWFEFYHPDCNDYCTF
jgi:hypothetical protein